MHWIILIIEGLVVGALGRLFHPGRDAMGLLVTFLVGLAAVLITGALIGHHGIWTFIVAVIVGVVLVALVGRVFESRSRSPRTA